MRYLVVDALLNGTGIRNKYEGGYLSPEEIGISSDTINQLNGWLSRYEKEHYNGFANSLIVNDLDREGKEIALMIKNELSKVKLEYFSAATMKKTMII
jgi:5S rRNA maturation endonuclease (ribonuclease M5)